MKARPYLIITRNSIMAALAYRGHFFFTLAGTVTYIVVSWFLWKAIYANGGTIGGLTFTQAFLYVGVSTSLYGFMRVPVDWYLNNIVRSGDLLRFLTKPINFTLQLFMDCLGEGAMNCIMIAIPSFILVFVLTGSGVPSPANALLFLPSVAIGYLINFYVDFLTGLSVFLTQSINGISLTKETIVTFLSGAIVPLAFFPANVRTVLEWLPFQALYNTPVRLLVDPALGAGDVLFFFMRQIAWLFVFYALARLLFAAALKKIVVNGG